MDISLLKTELKKKEKKNIKVLNLGKYIHDFQSYSWLCLPKKIK